MFGLKSLRKAVADAEMWQKMYRDEATLFNMAMDELVKTQRELSRWKPNRDMKGRFTHTAAVVPEIAGRDCSFIEREK